LSLVVHWAKDRGNGLGPERLLSLVVHWAKDVGNGLGLWPAETTELLEVS